ncbi:polysaccharide pyruvyl transferase family protein [Cetobacterium sp. SF1]|uniref:polysaccharide pyruvyl transferase family protein n=1 Tax=Cetobacterium sp. SF1 TaxID=3417654 RepID=UPI003CE87F4E
MKERIGLATVHTGYNYGTSLQALATKRYIENMGYQLDILGYKSSFIKGRDIRIKKILIMGLRMLQNPFLIKKTFLLHKKNLTKKIESETKILFDNFTQRKLQIKKMSYLEMKKYSRDKKTLALLCGSDQIWNGATLYVDPFYYLRFAPLEKRIAFSPSFGREKIEKYNENIIKKYLSEIKYLSTRENAGQKIIKKLVNKKAEVLIDPTLLLSSKEWLSELDKEEIINDKFIILYFLDFPCDKTLEKIKDIIKNRKEKIIVLPQMNENFFQLNKEFVEYSVGPLEFIDLINKSTLVLTDSFHGMLFSINFNKEFYVFERNYGVASNQSSRIESILNILNLKERYQKKDTKLEKKDINWSIVNDILEKERKKTKIYLQKSLKNIKDCNNEKK